MSFILNAVYFIYIGMIKNVFTAEFLFKIRGYISLRNLKIIPFVKYKYTVLNSNLSNI